MLKLTDIRIGIIRTLEAFSSHLQRRQANLIRFLSVSLLTFILTVTGIPTATAQLPFIPIPTETATDSEVPIFNALNKPFNCANLQLCSNVWMTGNFKPILTIASPSATVEQQNISLPVDLRARQIQRQLNLIQEEALRRARSNQSNPDISLNKSNTSAKKIILEQSRETQIGKTLTSPSERNEENLHPATPEIEVALENNNPVIFIPSQEGFLKQTLLSVQESDVIPNQALLVPSDIKQQEQIRQWREQISESNPNLSYRKTEAFVLARIWQNKIRQQLSNSLKEQGSILENPLFFVKTFSLTFAVVLLLSFIFFWLKKQVKARRRKLQKTLENLEKSVAVEPDTTSEELAAKAAQAEEAINAAKNTDSDQSDQKPARSSKYHNNSSDLADIPFDLVASGVESLWQYITQNSLKQQSFLKQRINLMLLFENISLWIQVIIWGVGIAVIMFFYAPTRVYAGLLATSPIWIALIWIFFSIADKVVDFFIDFLLSRWATEAQQTSSTPQRYTMRVKTYSAALSQMTTVIAYGLATILSLSVLGLSAQGLASAGIITLIATYILQPHITNIIRGCLILLTDQFAVGDVIVVGSVAGFVEKMNLYMTHLRGDEGRLISIPNGNIDIVQNLTKEWSRVDFKIEIAYDADIKHALEVIHQVAEEMRCEPQWQDLILEPASILGVDGITHNGILIQVWIKTQPIQQWAVGREFRLRIKLAFDREGIAIGMPQRLLWHHEGESSRNDGNGHHSQLKHSSKNNDN
jgi:small-conductance mechanosensitive channel